mgnify:FL=1
MSNDVFDSSDAARHSRPLKAVRYLTLDGPFSLEQGGQLPQVVVAYETWGQLNAARDNAVLICHALSGDSHAARHDPDDDPGWWDLVVGPGRSIDTDRYFVICPNILGGCRGTTGPNSINPDTGQPYAADFPVITVGDMVQVQRQLVDHLGIDRLRAVVGGSLGGHMALQWATALPDRLQGVVALATSPRLTSQAMAFDIVGRNAILRDPSYEGGDYYAHGVGPSVGLALARMLGHITYLSREAMMRKFDPHRLRPQDVRSQFETKFSVGSYLAYQGDKFVERFDANSYLTLTMAMDLFDLGQTAEELAERFRATTCRWLVVSFSSDWLFAPFQSQQIVDALIANDRPVSYCNVQSSCGHDAFLLADNLDSYGTMLHAFLQNLEEAPELPAEEDNGEGDLPPVVHAPTSIFHRRRIDYDSILELIPAQASVLDLGCGHGGLLAQLRQRGHRAMGVENDERSLVTCVRRGLDVVQADLNQGLAPFRDGQFDCVVLSQTLQAVMNVEKVIDEMLRVGRLGIVSFPNFGYWKLRQQLAEEGRAPRSGTFLGYAWYNSPNVRFLTIDDFREFCQNKAIRILQQVALDTQADQRVDEDPNRNADVAVVVISH